MTLNYNHHNDDEDAQSKFQKSKRLMKSKNEGELGIMSNKPDSGTPYIAEKPGSH